MTERDPIERLEASDGLSIEPRPEFASELRIMLDLRLRMTEGDAPSSERNEDGDEGDKAGSRQRPDRLQTLILALLAMLIFLAIGLVTYLAVWVITETDSSEPSTPTPTTTAPPPDETSASSPDPEASRSDLEIQLSEAGCRVLGPAEAPRFDCSGTDLSNMLLDGASHLRSRPNCAEGTRRPAVSNRARSEARQLATGAACTGCGWAPCERTWFFTFASSDCWRLNASSPGASSLRARACRFRSTGDAHRCVVAHGLARGPVRECGSIKREHGRWRELTRARAP